MFRGFRARVSWRVLVVITLGASFAAAAAPAHQEIGDTGWALPGVFRVGIPGPVSNGVVGVAATAGYGLTEAITDDDGVHHRASGSLAASVEPAPGLAFALRLDGRYDRHAQDQFGSDSGLTGDPRLAARWGTWLAPPIVIGIEALAWAPGRDAPSVDFDAVSPEARLLLASVAAPVSLALHGGFRWDRSGQAIGEPDRLRRGDRIALGLSDSNAALLGVGALVELGERFELLGEWTWDLLVGADAPAALESPMRVSAGGRYRVAPSWQLFAVADVALSSRPEVGAGQPLVPIEPRFGALIGLSARFGAGEPSDAGVQEDETLEPPPEEKPAAPQTGRLSVAVMDDVGAPVEATVRVTVGPQSRTLTRGADGAYGAPDVPAGQGTIIVEAGGYKRRELQVRVQPGAATDLKVELEQVARLGQIRGLVRSFRGDPVEATVRIEPGGHEVVADANGNFRLELAAGSYDVTISAPGYRTQKKTVSVEMNGVVILNADLYGEGR